MSTPIRVLRIEDKLDLAKAQCENLRSLLGPDSVDGPGWELEFEFAGNQEEADQILDQNEPDGFDLILLDLAYPPAPGLTTKTGEWNPRQGMDWLPELRRRRPQATIVIVSAHIEDFRVPELVQAVRRGQADDFINKGSGIREIATRIQVAHENARRRRQVLSIAEEYHAILRSLSLRVYAEDIGDLLRKIERRMENLAAQLEADDPSAIASAPDIIRTNCRDLRTEFFRLGAILLQGKDEKRRIDVANIVQQILMLYEYHTDISAIRIVSTTLKEEVPLITYVSDLKLAVHEVLRNSVDSLVLDGCPDGVAGLIEVSVEKRDDLVYIIVRDNGSGFSEKIRENLFSPGNTSRTPDKYMGIGLYVARRMLEALGGDIHCQDRSDGKSGAEVSLILKDLP